MNNPINVRVSQSGHCETLHSSKSSIFMVEKSAKSPLKKKKGPIKIVFLSRDKNAGMSKERIAKSIFPVWMKGWF